jgi:signal transduction histidine kinase
MGGDIEVNSEPGKGTSVLTWIPLGQNDDTNQPKQSED